MPQLNHSLTDNSRSIYFVLLLLMTASMATSQINFLVVAGHSILLPHRLFVILLFVFFVTVSISQQKIAFDWLDLAILLFLVVMVARLIFEIFQPYPLIQSVTIVVQLILGLALYFAIGIFDATRREFLVILRLWLLAVLLVSAYGFYQVFALNLGLPLSTIQFGAFSTKIAPLWEYLRPTSIFHEPTHYSAFVLPAYVFITVTYYRGHDTDLLFERGRWNDILIAFIWLNYFFIASLGGYIVIVALVLLATLLDRRFRRISLTLGLGAVAAITLIVAFGEGFEILYAPVHRIVVFVRSVFGLVFFGGTVGGSIGVRLMRLYWSLLIWLEHPLFGIGINNSIFLDLVPPDWCNRCGTKPPATHSVFGFIVTSTGLVGLVSYLLMYGTAGRYLYQAWQAFEIPLDRAITEGITFTILTNVLLAFFTLPIVHSLNWFFIGLASIAISRSHSGQEDAPAPDGSKDSPELS